MDLPSQEELDKAFDKAVMQRLTSKKDPETHLIYTKMKKEQREAKRKEAKQKAERKAEQKAWEKRLLHVMNIPKKKRTEDPKDVVSSLIDLTN